MKYYPLDFAVQGAMNEAGETTPHQYARYLQFAFDACRDDISRLLPHYLVTVKLTMEENNTLTLPMDCVKVIKLGVQYGDIIRIFSEDENMGLQRSSDDCANPLPHATSQERKEPTISLSNFVDGNDATTYTLFGYGYPKNQIGYYRIDYERNQVQFGSNVSADEIYVEYKSNGLTRAEEAIIPEIAVKPVKNYIHWKRLQFKRSVNNYDKENAKKEYTTSIKEMKLRQFMFNEKNFLETMRKSRRQVMKY